MCIKLKKKRGAIGLLLPSVLIVLMVLHSVDHSCELSGGFQQPQMDSAAGRPICNTNALLFLTHSLLLSLALVNIFSENVPRVLLLCFL